MDHMVVRSQQKTDDNIHIKLFGKVFFPNGWFIVCGSRRNPKDVGPLSYYRRTCEGETFMELERIIEWKP